ncbi:MAG: hypothetical protein AAF919_19215 [Pseudomonadota bacterium]
MSDGLDIGSVRLRAASVAVALMLGLAGCVTAPAPIPVVAGTGPGPDLIEPTEAGALFARACIGTRPRFDGIAQALDPGAFQQATGTGTYFHQRFNLSLNATPARCSMVFATDRPDAEVVPALARGTTSVVPPGEIPRDISVSSNVDSDGLRYFRMALPGGGA